jgi:hypothetical protein
MHRARYLSYGGSNDAFLAVLPPGGATLAYATYFGRASGDLGLAVGVGPDHTASRSPESSP